MLIFLEIASRAKHGLDGRQSLVEVVVVALGGVELLAHIVGLSQRVVALLHSVGCAVVGVLRGTLGMGGTALALLLGGEGLLYGVERLLGGGTGIGGGGSDGNGGGGTVNGGTVTATGGSYLWGKFDGGWICLQYTK